MPLREDELLRGHEDAVGPLADHGGERALEIVWRRDVHLDDSDADRWRCRLEIGYGGSDAGIRGIHQERYPRGAGRGFLQKLEILEHQLADREGQAGDVPARPREAGDESVANGVAHAPHDDGNGAGHLHGCPGHGSVLGDDDADAGADEVGSELGQTVVVAFRRTLLDDEISALDPAEIGECLPVRGKTLGVDGRRGVPQVTDPCWLALLRDYR